MAKLVSEAQEQARRAEELVSLPLRQGLVDEWSKPVYTPSTNLDGPIHQQAVSAEALTYLHSVASVLCLGEARENPELPGDDELAELLDQIDDLAASIETATDLADDVKSALLRRIAEVRLAVQNARIGGEEGVREAVERLLRATAVRQNATPKSTIKRIRKVAGVVYAVCLSGPMIEDSLEAWPHNAETRAREPAHVHELEAPGSGMGHAGGPLVVAPAGRSVPLLSESITSSIRRVLRRQPTTRHSCRRGDPVASLRAMTVHGRRRARAQQHRLGR